MATRKQWNAKISRLNKKRVKSAKELESTMKELVSVAFEEVAYLIVMAILKVYPRTIERTPVDTGRTRAAWLIDSQSSEFVPPKDKEFEEYKQNVLAIATQQVTEKFDKLTQADVIKIINNVEYILALEAGWSKQSSGFIALMIHELNITLSAIVKVKKAA